MPKETYALGIRTELGMRVVGHEVCPHPIQRTVRVAILIWGSEEKEGGRWRVKATEARALRAGKGLCPTDQERKLHTVPGWAKTGLSSQAAVLEKETGHRVWGVPP